MTNRKANRAALTKVKEEYLSRLASHRTVPEKENAPKTYPVSDATRSVLMGMQLQARGIKEMQDGVALAVSAYNSTMQAVGALAAKVEMIDTKDYQLDVDGMVWVGRKK